jgi:uncharacterized membrane protein YdjX (TVP38/TMEM64 family)
MLPITEQQAPSAEAAATDFAAAAEARPPWRRIAALALLVAVLLGVVYLSPLRSYLGRVRELSDAIRGLGMLAPVVLTLSVALLVALGVPRLLLCVVSGMALGFWSGLLWVQLGTLLGNYALFLVARLGGGDWVRRYVEKRGKLAALIQREGVTGVILARQLPVPGLLVNLGFGLVSIRHRDFLLGTVIGQLPEAVPCTMIGAGVLKASFAKSAGWIGLAVILAVLAWLGLRRVLRSRQR